MSTAPRNARRGEKKVALGAAAAANEAGMSPTPTPPIFCGPVDLSSFLAEMSSGAASSAAGSSAGSGAAAAAPISSIMSSAVGVVRGRARDNQTAIKERDPAVTQTDVEATLRKSFAALGRGKASPPRGGTDVGDAQQLQAASVTLIAASALSQTAARVLASDAAARVLVVTSLEEALGLRDATPQAGFWCGAERRLPAGESSVAAVRMWCTTFRAMASLLGVFVRGDGGAAAAAACPFTHIFVAAKDGRCSPLFDATLSTLCSLVAAGGRWARTRLLLCGVSGVDEVAALLAGLSSQSLVKAALHSPSVLTPSDAAALVGTVVKEHAPSPVSMRRLPGAVATLPCGLVDHGVFVAACRARVFAVPLSRFIFGGNNFLNQLMSYP